MTGLYCQSGDVREGRKESTRKQVGKHIEFSLVPGMKPLHEVAGAGRTAGVMWGCSWPAFWHMPRSSSPPTEILLPWAECNPPALCFPPQLPCLT